jgi:hypothetical protein
MVIHGTKLISGITLTPKAEAVFKRLFKKNEKNKSRKRRDPIGVQMALSKKTKTK